MCGGRRRLSPFIFMRVLGMVPRSPTLYKHPHPAAVSNHLFSSPPRSMSEDEIAFTHIMFGGSGGRGLVWHAHSPVSEPNTTETEFDRLPL